MTLDESSNSPGSLADWPPIDRSLFGEARPAPAAFPLHLLPGRWRAWVEMASQALGSADYLANCLLAGVAGVSGAGTRVFVTWYWTEPLVLWQALVGGPSSGKSAAFSPVRGLLADVKPQQQNSDRGAPSVLVDARLEQVDTALETSGRVLLWRADLGDWMDEAARRAERPAWLAGWNAGPAMIGRTPQACFAVGILGALSPERLAPGFIDGDGALAARFLYAWPPQAGVPSLADVDGPEDPEMVALLQKIADFAVPREKRLGVVLDEAAAQRLEELMAELRRRADEASGVEAEWIAKGVSTLVRLAGLFALMQWAEAKEPPDMPPVEAAHLDAAYELWSGYYLPQAQAVFDRGGIAGCERAARRVTRWLTRLRAPEISREDVRRQALCQTVNAEGAEDVLARLEAGGVLRPLQASGSVKGGPRRRRWAVHPELASRPAGSWRS
jgi:hypothetical protein